MNNERTIDFLIAELIEKNKELHRWLTGKCRVFWRVRYDYGSVHKVSPIDMAHRDDALDLVSEEKGHAKLYRVTVRPKAKQ